MQRTISLLVALSLLGISARPALATAPLNGCNSAGECRAELAAVYTNGDSAFIVLQGHLLPTVCTSAAWGYYWKVPLVSNADRARYATLLSAYMTHEVVEVRALDAACTVMASNLGE